MSCHFPPLENPSFTPASGLERSLRNLLGNVSSLPAPVLNTWLRVVLKETALEALSSRLGFPLFFFSFPLPRSKGAPPFPPPPRGQIPSLPSNGRRETLARPDTLNPFQLLKCECAPACVRVCCVRGPIKAQQTEREAGSGRAVCAVTLLTHVCCRNRGRFENHPVAPRD